MAVEKKVPEMRFEGFSGEWEVEKFKNLTKINQGLQIEISSRYTYKVDNSYFYITNEFLKEGSDYKYYIVNPPVSVLCNEDDILMTRTGNTGHVVTNISGAFHNNFFKIKFDKKVLDKNFLAHYLKWNKTQQNILRAAGSSTIPDLNHNDFYNIEIAYSSIEEQTAIGNTFQKLDTLIKQQQQKHDQLSNIKKAMLAKMFPKQGETRPEIRFKGFSGEWEDVRIGDVVNCFSGGTPLVGIDEYYRGNIPFIRSAEINRLSTELTISELGLKNSSAKIVEIGTVLYALYGATSGEVGRARLSGAINQAILAIIPKAEICSEFLSHWLRKSKANIVSTYLQGGQGNLSGDIVKNLMLKLPDFEEQTAIGNYFQKLDTLIKQQQQQITKLNHIKQACLRKMFV